MPFNSSPLRHGGVKRSKKRTLTQGDAENRDNDPVDLTILGSSIQVHADAQRLLEGIIDGVESWGQFPREKRRLMDLVARSGGRTVFISGDVHHSEIGGAARVENSFDP